jgi:anti-sigma regulatory factor (Ser/Thr protein kinase)
MSAVRHHETAVSGTLEGAIAAADWMHEVATKEQLSSDLTFAIDVCLEELLTNIARHGAAAAPVNGDPSAGERPTVSVRISLTITDEVVELMVEDDGRAFDVSKAPARPVHQPLAEVPVGGLGLKLIRSFTSDIGYRRLNGRNLVTLHFSPIA